MFRPRGVLSSLALLAILSLVAAGCSDRTMVAPEAHEGPQLSLQAEGFDLAGQYVVLLQGKKGAAFEAKVQALGGSVTFSHPVGLAIVDGLSDEAATQLKGDKLVFEMLQNVSFGFDAPLSDLRVEAVASTPLSPVDPSTAPIFPYQWNMRAIKAPEAWAGGRTGSPEVTVAILDTGIDYTYPDLLDLVDLSRSTSFIPEDDAMVPVYFPDYHVVTDLHYHGTHVAATVASNASVAAGLTSQTTLMGVKVCSWLGQCPIGAVLSGVLFAADKGADVINLSLGGYFTKAGSQGWVGFINRIFNYAGSQGATVVVAAGNESVDLDHDGNGYKTYCSAPSTICISATGPTGSEGVSGPWENVDAPASYTNFGRSAINVAAPGGTGAGFVWAACSTTSLISFSCQTGISVLGLAGTSMAAPHVAGLAALVVEDVGRNPGRVKTLIQQGADDLGQRGTDPFYGKGRINVIETVRH
jgi:subtilisin family serine protease